MALHGIPHGRTSVAGADNKSTRLQLLQTVGQGATTNVQIGKHLRERNILSLADITPYIFKTYAGTAFPRFREQVRSRFIFFANLQ